MKVTKRWINQVVETALEPYQPTDYRIEVVKDGVEKHGDTWFVVVQPSREDVKSHDFGARIAEAAADLMERNDVMIQLTTVLPQHAA